MRSLQARLYAALSLAVLLFWCGWGLWAAWWTWRDVQGFADTSLRDTAELILQSLPARVLALPAEAPARPAHPNDTSGAGVMGSAFEVWVGGQSLLRSPNAPRWPAASRQAPGFSDELFDGRPYRVYSASDGARRLQVRVARQQTAWAAETWSSVQFGLLNGLLLMLPLLALVRAVVRWSFQPVTTLSATLRDKPELDFSPLPLVGLPSELRRLVEAFNRMLERLGRALDRERRFIGDAAHELRTPLAALGAQAHVALRATGVADKDAALLQLAAGVERSARLAAQLLALAQLDAAGDPLQHQAVNLSEVVALVVRDAETVAHQRGLRISLQLAPAMVWGQLDELGMLVRNLLDNALRYTPSGGQVRCTVHTDGDGAASEVCLSVLDDGPGVAPDQQARIFERFYRVPGNTQAGSGIGLSLVARIAQRHEARIELGPGLAGRGLGLRLYFPAWLDPDGLKG